MIPVTTSHCSLINLPGAVAHAFYHELNEVGFLFLDSVKDDPRCYSDNVNAIFRVYPKGQNPLSINKTK